MFLCLLIFLNLLFCGLLYTGFRFIVPVVSGVGPQGLRVGSVCCVGFLVEGTGAYVVVDEAGACLSDGQDCVRWCVLVCL